MAETKVLKGVVVDEQGRDLTKSRGSVKKKSEVIEYLDKEVIVQKLKEIDNPRDHMFISFLWNTGVRVSEAVAVEKQHLDFENQEAKIRWLKNRRYEKRTIPLSGNITALLKLYTNGMKYDQKIFSFTRQTGFNICDKHFSVGPHTFRHSFAVNFLRHHNNAMAIVHLQKLLGHANIRTTMKYLHAVPSDLHEAMKSVEFN